MRRFISLFLLFSVITVVAHAGQQPSSTAKAATHDAELKSLNQMMCNNLMATRVSGMSLDRLLNLSLSRYFRVPPDAPGFHEKVQQFWDTHYAQLICDDIKDRFTKTKSTHLSKRAFDLNQQDAFIFDFLLNEDRTYLNINAVDYSFEGKPETLLDFLERIYNNPKRYPRYDLNEVKELIMELTDDYGAKRAREL